MSKMLGYGFFSIVIIALLIGVIFGFPHWVESGIALLYVTFRFIMLVMATVIILIGVATWVIVIGKPKESKNQKEKE